MQRFGSSHLTAVGLIILSLTTVTGAEEPTTAPAGPTRVACVGDSITAGVGTANPAAESYPAQLAKMLGSTWKVENFGVSGSTLLNAGDKPYQKEPAFKHALAFNPDVVVIMLGTNDTKPQNWPHHDEFIADYKQLVDQFRQASPKAHIYVCIPVPVVGSGAYGIVETGIEAEKPMIEKVAADEHATLIDMHKPLEGKDALIPDKVHPSTAGATIMAQTVNHALAGSAKE